MSALNPGDHVSGSAAITSDDWRWLTVALGGVSGRPHSVPGGTRAGSVVMFDVPREGIAALRQMLDAAESIFGERDKAVA